MDKRRIGGIDLIRILCMVWILAFHAQIHCAFSFRIEWVDRLISVGAIGCTGFFMMSGFTLRYKELCSEREVELVAYLKNKMIRLFPIYYFMLIVSIVFQYKVPDNMGHLISLLPIQLSLFQGFFYPQIVNYFFNDNTWFLSVLWILYLLFPFINSCLNEVGLKTKKILMFVFMALSFYIYYVNIMVEPQSAFLTYYTNPVYRIPEFMSGILCADFSIERPKECSTKMYILQYGILTGIAIFATVNVFYPIWQTDYNLYNFIFIPYFWGVLFLSEGLVNESVLNKFFQCKIIIKIEKLTLSIYLGQSFSIMTKDLLETDLTGVGFIALTFFYAIVLKIIFVDFVNKVKMKLCWS